ncbi:MAG TPA: hypothetical protein VGR26_18350 [Acidimicrobiales bacterium]|nr:hypothetical protein [Acidimicrobiales bacterium]
MAGAAVPDAAAASCGAEGSEALVGRQAVLAEEAHAGTERGAIVGTLTVAAP